MKNNYNNSDIFSCIMILNYVNMHIVCTQLYYYTYNVAIEINMIIINYINP